MPPAFYTSKLATCLCRQFRPPLRNFRIPPAYRCFSSFIRRHGGVKGKEPVEIGLESTTELLILRPPAPPKPRHEDLRIVEAPAEGEETPETMADKLLENQLMDARSIDIALARPATDLQVSKERHEQLEQGLSKSFLRQQLFEYYRIQDTEGTPPKLHCTATKLEIIRAILSDKWGVTVSNDIPERLDVLGNRDFQGTLRDIYFILGKDGRTIRRLSQQFEARIKVNVESGKISVNSSLENYERLRSAIQDLLSGVNIKDFDISWAKRLCRFNEQFITPIARITGTYIEKKDEKTLVISALDPGSLQDARRLLFMSFDLQLRSSYSLLYNAPKGEKDPKGALYPVREKSALPWNLRGVEWGRWRNIKTLIEGSGGLQVNGSAILKDTLRRRTRGVTQDTNDITAELREMLDHDDLRVPAQHLSELSTEYEAIFGCLLHENSDPPLDDPTAPEFIESKDRPQAFLPDVPGLVYIAQSLSPVGSPTSERAFHTSQVQVSVTERRTPDQTCIVKLLPSPWGGYPEDFDRYPPLELGFRVDPESGNVGQPTLKAIHSSTIADAMFPGEECDVRFRHRKSVSLGILDDSANPGPECGVTRLELTNYLSQSRLNPLVDNELKPSQILRVKLPEWMIAPPERPESEDEGEERSLPTTMEYFSTSLEYRRELAFDWNGMELYQTVVQGGITGGKRSEFRLCWNNREGADPLAEAPRIAELEDGDKVVDRVAEASTDGVVEPSLEATAQIAAVSDTEAIDGIPGEPVLNTDLEDVDESGDKITEATTDQSLRHAPQNPYCNSSPNPGFSFAEFLTNTTDLVERLGKFLASGEWRFTTQSTSRVAVRSGTSGMEWDYRGDRGTRSGRGGRNGRYTGAAGSNWGWGKKRGRGTSSRG